MLIHEIKLFFTALMFYTRIPVPFNIGYSDEMLNKSTRYFPIIGGLVGGIGALLFYGLQFVFPVSIAILFSIIGTIYTTGAFHEDGFADFCDGFGGGYTKEKILEIMKDSRLGTYGAIGIMSILATKYVALIEINTIPLPLIILTGNMYSRVFPVMLIYTSSYCRLDELSKTKPIGKQSSWFSFVFALFTGLSILWFIPAKVLFFTVPLNCLAFLLFRANIMSKTGGYTGDILGALQQISEVLFYISILLWQKLL